jgi:hypothetical protein
MAKKEDIKRKVRWTKFIIISLLILVTLIVFKRLFFTLLFFILAVLSTQYRKFINLSIGLELNFFGTALLSMAYGPIYGVFVGPLSTIVGALLDSSIRAVKFIVALLLVFVSYGFHYLKGYDLMTVALILNIIFLILTTFFAWVLEGIGSIGSSLLFAIGNLFFNYLFFKLLAEVFLMVMV